MSFKKLSIVTVYILMALVMVFLSSPTPFPKTSLTVGEVLAAATQNTITKRVVSLTIQDQQIDLSNPDAKININLPGNPGEAQTFNIPIPITYDDGSTRYLTFTFNYQPPSVPPPEPEPVKPAETCDYEEDASSCPNGGLQTCTGIRKEENGEIKCKYDGSVDPNCRNIRCSQPPPEQQRCEQIHLRNECVGCNESQKIYQQYCNGGISGNPYAGERQSDSACSSWCASSQPPPDSQPPPPPPPRPAECEDVYYCEDGTTIHKHGYHDGNGCQYSWDDIGEPC